MTTTSYTITDADKGRFLPIKDGFLVNLTRTQASPPGYEIPDFDPGRQRWKTARFVLRGTKDIRDLCCIDTQSGGGAGGGGFDSVWANASVAYTGELEVVCVPKGSTWSLQLSDVPNVRAPRDAGFGAYADNRPQGGWSPAPPHAPKAAAAPR
jgi:hypothetical protein